MLVHRRRQITIITKEVLGRSGVYRLPLPLDERRTVRLERVTEVDVGVGVKVDTDLRSRPTLGWSPSTYGSALGDGRPGAPGSAVSGGDAACRPTGGRATGALSYRADRCGR
jgi:hypothetical protein